MKISFIFFIFSVLYLGFGVFISSLSFENNTTNIESDFYDYSGVLNVHSNKSGGSSSVQEIISAANDAELDFISFNSENPINKKQPSPITFGNLNVFYGLELSYKNSRFLSISPNETKVFESKSNIEISMSNALDSDGEDLIILAHPSKEGRKWEYSIPKSLTGIEVINLREVWNNSWKNNKTVFLFSLIFYPFNPKLFFLKIFSKKSTSENLLNEWNKEKLVLGYLGSDATSKLQILSNSFIQFPGYKTIFSLAKNHILLEEELTGTKNHSKIIQALKNGNSYFSLDVLGNPKGFAIYTDENNQRRLVSKKLTLGKKVYINVPDHDDKYRVIVLLDGKKYATFSESNSFTVKKAGVYRVRVELKPKFPFIRSSNWIPWIYSNPFKVTEPQLKAS